MFLVNKNGAKVSNEQHCTSDRKYMAIEKVSRCLLSSAIAGHRRKCDLAVNDWLKWTNHCTDLTKRIIPLLPSIDLQK